MRKIVLGAIAAISLLAVLPPAQAESGSLPAIGTRIDAAKAPGVKGAWQESPGRWVVPLRASRPSWVTSQLLRAARRGPAPAPSSAIADLPADGLVGIRPGSMEIAPYGCTMDFIFQKGRSLAIGTAGHCTDRIGEDVTLLTLAPGSGNPVIVDVGTVVARQFSPNKIAPDFALVAINPQLYGWVFPTIAQVLGPCGVYAGSGLASVAIPSVFRHQDTSVGPELLSYYGQGAVVATDSGVSRAGVALYWDSDAYYFDSPALPGDSGSPVHTSALAGAGNLTDLVVDTSHPGAITEGTRLTTIVAQTGWSLVNSPYC